MRILISGGSGFLGAPLTRRLRASGYDVTTLVRPGRPVGAFDLRWDPAAPDLDTAAMESIDAIVHFSGAGIADRRWSRARKSELRSSRIDTTRFLVDALIRLNRKPRVFVCASAVGYYGDRGDEILTEKSPCGTEFLALLTRDWEAEATRAAQAGIRTVPLRFGVVLAPDGGALPKMLAPIRRGIGGRLGSGRQWMSWVALDDAVEAAHNAIFDERYSGAINVVAPYPVRNAQFVRFAATLLGRHAIFPAPAFALRIALGEMAHPLLLTSQRVTPQRLTELSFTFRYEKIETALQEFLHAKG